jgi:hypothetical protein
MSDVFVVVIDDCTGIIENQDENSLSIYPNPAADILNVLVNSGTNSGIITLYDMNGRVILEKEIPMNTDKQAIEVSWLNKGIYFVQFKSGEKVLSSKFIKNK